MAENEFEKQVHQKMEELKLNPSGEVWKNVEVQIRKEKKRKWLLLLLLLLFIFFGGMFLWKNNQPTGNVLEKGFTGTASAVINDKKGTNVSEVKSKNSTNEKLAKSETIISNNNYHTKQFVYIKKTRARFKSKQSMNEVGVNDGNEITVRSKSKMKVSVVTGTNDSSNNDIVEQKILDVSSDTTNTVFDSLKKEQEKSIVVNADSNKKNKVEMIKNVDKTKDTSAKKNEGTKHEWDLGVQLGIGMSATGNNYLVNNGGNIATGMF